MKTLILSIVLSTVLLSTSENSFAQKIRLDDSDRRNISFAMLGGGVTMTVISVTTPLEWGRDVNNRAFTQPFHQNPAHMMGLISGVGISAGGVITLLANSGKRKRR